MIANTATFARVIPPSVLRRVNDRPAFLRQIARYVEMDDDDLLRATEVCLRNLERLGGTALESFGGTFPDGDLQVVLVPELWERLRPGTRPRLRRITCSLAEYNPDVDRPSIFARLLAPKALTNLRDGAEFLRHHIKLTERLDAEALVEQVRFAIAGSRVSDRWEPSAYVYEPGFVYRLVPAIAWRVLSRDRRRDQQRAS